MELRKLEYGESIVSKNPLLLGHCFSLWFAPWRVSGAGFCVHCLVWSPAQEQMICAVKPAAPSHARHTVGNAKLDPRMLAVIEIWIVDLWAAVLMFNVRPMIEQGRFPFVQSVLYNLLSQLVSLSSSWSGSIVCIVRCWLKHLYPPPSFQLPCFIYQLEGFESWTAIRLADENSEFLSCQSHHCVSKNVCRTLR